MKLHLLQAPACNRRLVAALVLLVGVNATAPSARALDPLALIATLNQVGTMKALVTAQVQKIKSLTGGRAGPRRVQVGPELEERLRSPYADDRQAAVTELQKLSEQVRDGEVLLVGGERLEVLTRQLLRDQGWRTRRAAYHSLVNLGMMAPVEDKSELFAMLFSKDAPERSYPEDPAQQDLRMIASLLNALNQDRGRTRKLLAAVLSELDVAGAATAQRGIQTDVPPAGGGKSGGGGLFGSLERGLGSLGGGLGGVTKGLDGVTGSVKSLESSIPFGGGGGGGGIFGKLIM